jgi:hypothetical protein
MDLKLEKLVEKIEKYVNGIFKMNASRAEDGNGESVDVTPNISHDNKESAPNNDDKMVFVVNPEDVLDADAFANLSRINESENRSIVPITSQEYPLDTLKDWSRSELSYLKDIVYMQNRIFSVVSQMENDVELLKDNIKFASKNVGDSHKEIIKGQQKANEDKKKKKDEKEDEKKASELQKLIGQLGIGKRISRMISRIPVISSIVSALPTLGIIAKILRLTAIPILKVIAKIFGAVAGGSFGMIGLGALTAARSVARSRGGQAVGRGARIAGARLRDGVVAVGTRVRDGAIAVGRGVGDVFDRVASTRGGQAIGRGAKIAGSRVRDGAVAVGGRIAETGKAVGSGIAKAGLRGSSILKTALKGGRGVFAPLAAGLSLLTMASDVSAANMIQDPTERAKAKASAIGGGLGGSAGGIVGALAGSIFGPVGTALGGALGSWLGEKGGAMIGEAINEVAPQIKEHFSNTKKYITDAFDSGPIEGFKTIFKDLFDTKPVQAVKDLLANTFDFLFPNLAEIRKTIASAFDIGIVDAFKNLILTVFGADIGEALKDTLKRAWLNIVEGMRRAALRIPFIGDLFRNKGDDAREKIEKNNEKIVNLTARLSDKNVSEKEKANIQKEIDSLKADNAKQQEIVNSTDFEKEKKELDERELKREQKTEAEKKKNIDHGLAQKKVEEDRIKENLKRQVAEIEELRKTDPELAQKKYDALKPDLKRYGLIDRVDAPWNIKTADVNGSDAVVPTPIDNVADSIVLPAETAPVRRLEERQNIENQRTADKAVAERVAAEATARSANGGNNAVNNNTSVYNTNIENHVDSLNASNRNISNAEQWGGD